MSITSGGTVDTGGGSSNGSVDNAASKELQAALEKLKLEKEIADTQKAIAEAQKATVEANKGALEAQLPAAGQAKPLEGTVTTDTDFGFIAELVAHHAIKLKAGELAESVAQAIPENAHVLITDNLDFCGEDIQVLQVMDQLAYYRDEFAARIEDCTKSLPAQTPSPLFVQGWIGPASLLPAVPGMISAAADIVGYFQSNFEVKSRKVTLANTAIHAIVAGRIKKPGVRLHLPGFHRVKAAPVLDLLKQCITARQTLGRLAAMLKSTASNKKQAEQVLLQEQITTQEAELKTLVSPESDEKIQQISREIAEKKDRLANMPSLPEEQISAAAETLVQHFDTFNTAITTVAQGKTNPPVFEIAIRQYLDQVGITHILYLAALSAGGEAILEKRLFRSGDIAYLGGGAIACILVDINGAVLYSSEENALARVNYNLGQRLPPVFD